jgi:cell filamentation protein
MKETLILKHLDFINFVQQTEGYRVTEKAEHFARLVLDEDLSADEAVTSIIESYGLQKKYEELHTADGLYPDTDVYINYFDLKDQDMLDDIESEIVSVRMAQLILEKKKTTFDFDHLKRIHKALFADIYPFAAQVRQMSVTKRTVFCLPQYIDSMASQIFEKLKEERYLHDQEHEEFVDNLAYYMAEIHALHPFLDGNTRTMRLFFLELCNEANWDLDFSDSDSSRFLEADIASLEGDYQPLITILLDVVVPL